MRMGKGRKSRETRDQTPMCRVVTFPDGTYGRICTTQQEDEYVDQYVDPRVAGYVEYMYDRLLDWLNEDEIYDEPEEIEEYADEYIYEKLWYAPVELTPCDGGSPSVTMFIDYIFKGELWSDSYIADTLLGWRFEPEDMRDTIEVVNCYYELLAFREALKSLIKVEIKGDEDEEG
jgi:hypothetical protein